MAFDIGAITGKLILDASKWDAAINKAKADSKSFEGAVLRNEGAVRKLGLALGVTGAAISAMNLKMISMAATAIESENLFEVSLGGMQDAARDWSKELSKSLGINQFEIRRTVGTMDVMLKSMGIGEQAAYDMSTALVQLSYDMASFFNITTEEAFNKIQSGMVGMTRPLQDLGIIVNETAVKQFALNAGWIQQGQELTEQQKVLGRFAVIMQSTTAAQGDMARTIDSTANMWRVFNSRVQEASVTLGNTLLPIVDFFLGQGIKLVTLLQNMAENFPRLTAGIVITTAAFGALLVPIGALLLALPGLAAAAVAMNTTMGAALGIITVGLFKLVAAAAAVYFVFTKWDFLTALFYSFAEGVNYAIGQALEGLSKFLAKLSEISPLFKEQFKGLSESMLKSSEEMMINADLMGQKSADALQAQEEKNNDFTVKVEASFDGLKDKGSDMWQAISDEAKKAMEKMANADQNWLEKLSASFNIMEEIGKRTFNAMADSFSNLFFDIFKGEVKSAQEFFAKFGESILKIIADIIAQWLAMKIITGLFGGLFGGATAAVAAPAAGGLSIPAYQPLSLGGSFDTGTDYVPHDMIAKVHEGEQIIRPGEESGRNIELTLYNVVTPEEIAKAMATKEGRGVIVNTFETNFGRGGVVRKTIKAG